MNSVVIRLILTSCFIFVFDNAFSQKWIPLGSSVRDDAVIKQVLEDDENSYKVRISLNGLYDNEVTNEFGTFHSVSFGTGGQLNKEGEPSLPVIPYLIAIPPGTTPDVSIENELWDGISIGKILPAQKQSFVNVEDSVFYIKEEAYDHSYIPQMIKLTQEMNWRGIRNVGIQICPFKYNPQLDSLCVLKEFVLNIAFKKQNNKATTSNIGLQKEHGRFGVFDNTVYSEPLTLNNRSNDNYDYLIILGNNSICDTLKLKEFRRWKALKGYKTKVVTCNSIGSSDTAIKNYISSEYSNGVRYVLLVGNDSIIPSHEYRDTVEINGITYYKEIPSDYWYGCILGNDEEQDVAIGRFPVSSSSQFSNIINKTIKYETWKNLMYRTMLVVYKDEDEITNFYQICCDDIAQYHYSEPMVFHSIYGEDSASTNAYVTSLINQGSHIVNYRGHASESYWGKPSWNKIGESYTTSQLDSINGNTNTVFFSITCKTGNITTDTCMLVKFLCSPNGAAAFLGSSLSSDNTINTKFDKKLFINLLDSTIYCYGDLNMKSFIDVFKENLSGNLARDNAYSYVCGGDPTLEIWTANPQKFMDVDINYANGNMIIKKTDTCSVMINVSSPDGELLNSVSMNTQTMTIPKPANKFYLSLIKHNKIPYVVYCDFERNMLNGENVDYNGFYGNTPFSMGRINNESSGDVVVKNGSKLTVKLGSGGVLLNKGFSVESGGSLIIK